MVENFFKRLDGPLHFRFILQPLMAATFAIIDGIKDVKAGKNAFLLAVIFEPEQRRVLLKDCWRRVSKVFILAIILDLIYQLKVHHSFYPGETLIVAFVLAIVPYVVLRGPVKRIVKLFKKRNSA
jgi:hypothetical protein